MHECGWGITLYIAHIPGGGFFESCSSKEEADLLHGRLVQDLIAEYDQENPKRTGLVRLGPTMVFKPEHFVAAFVTGPITPAATAPADGLSKVVA